MTLSYRPLPHPSHATQGYGRIIAQEQLREHAPVPVLSALWTIIPRVRVLAYEEQIFYTMLIGEPTSSTRRSLSPTSAHHFWAVAYDDAVPLFILLAQLTP